MSFGRKLLTVRGLRVSFRQDGRDIEAVKGVSFEVREGEIFDVQQERSDVRRSIGLVFQQPTLDLYLTASILRRVAASGTTCWTCGSART